MAVEGPRRIKGGRLTGSAGLLLLIEELSLRSDSSRHTATILDFCDSKMEEASLMDFDMGLHDR